jgi:small-conductance mechanosensitive channel
MGKEIAFALLGTGVLGWILGYKKQNILGGIILGALLITLLG